MDFHPVRFVKQHPVGTAVCIAIGYFGPRYGLMIPGLSLRGRANVGSASDSNYS